jgi:hypothetical protein
MGCMDGDTCPASQPPPRLPMPALLARPASVRWLRGTAASLAPSWLSRCSLSLPPPPPGLPVARSPPTSTSPLTRTPRPLQLRLRPARLRHHPGGPRLADGGAPVRWARIERWRRVAVSERPAGCPRGPRDGHASSSLVVIVVVVVVVVVVVLVVVVVVVVAVVCCRW